MILCTYIVASNTDIIKKNIDSSYSRNVIWLSIACTTRSTIVIKQSIYILIINVGGAKPWYMHYTWLASHNNYSNNGLTFTCIVNYSCPCGVHMELTCPTHALCHYIIPATIIELAGTCDRVCVYYVCVCVCVCVCVVERRVWGWGSLT